MKTFLSLLAIYLICERLLISHYNVDRTKSPQDTFRLCEHPIPLEENVCHTVHSQAEKKNSVQSGEMYYHNIIHILYCTGI